jgi:hypothetical protein
MIASVEPLYALGSVGWGQFPNFLISGCAYFGVGSPFSASCFNVQLINFLTKWQDFARNCGVAFAESSGDIYIFIRARNYRINWVIDKIRVDQDTWVQNSVMDMMLPPVFE